LAERHAADQRAQWQRSNEDKCQKAHEASESARQECRENAARLETFERQQQEALGGTAGLSNSADNTAGQASSATRPLVDASRQQKPQRAMIDNPLWLDLRRQVSDLERRRDQLLEDRTPLHPAVREIEGHLADVKEQLSAAPRQIPDDRVETAATANAPAIAVPPIVDLAAKENQRKLDALAATLEKSRLACEKAERAEKEAAQEQPAAPQFAVESAEVVQNPPQVDYGWRRLLWTTFSASILMVFGIAFVAVGARIEPSVASVEEVEADLGESIIGALPAEGSPPDVAAIHRQARLRRAAIALGVLLILACPALAIWGVTGI
jgi:hypothetical protein